MIMADTVAIALSIIGFLLSLQGLWLVSAALWPRRVRLAAGRCEVNAIRSFFVGVVVTTIMVVVTTIAGKAMGAVGQVIAWAIVSLYTVYANVGVAGLATHVGRRLPSPADERMPWRATIRGGVALELMFLIPIVGWVVLLPISIIIGSGAATLTFFGRTSRAAEVAPPLPAAPADLHAERRELVEVA
jgi:hypothetical protein